MPSKRTARLLLLTGRVRAALLAAKESMARKSGPRRSLKSFWRDSRSANWSTFQNYLKRDMSEAAVLDRSARRGDKRIFTSEDEKEDRGGMGILAGKIPPRSVRVFILKAFGRSVSQSFVSKLLNRHGISRHRARGKDYRTRRSDLEKEVRTTIRNIQNLVRSAGGPQHVVSIDATGFWSTKTPDVTYAADGAYAVNRFYLFRTDREYLDLV